MRSGDHVVCVCVKILTLKDDLSEELPEDRQGKMLIHTEYSLLSMLQDQDGVIHHHGLFQASCLPLTLVHGHQSLCVHYPTVFKVATSSPRVLNLIVERVTTCCWKTSKWQEI